MKLSIDIPPQFVHHFAQDCFEESFDRIIADIRYSETAVSGLYELELLYMLQSAFCKANRILNEKGEAK